MRRFLKVVAAALVCIGATLLRPALGAPTDGAFIMSTPANEAPDYESDYAASQRLSGLTGNTPESDARPGEYYFLEAVHALRKHDYAFAIQMYQVSASWAYKPAEYNLGVMYAQGQGVETDLPRAMAWMALAAERNEPHYVEAREAVYASITPAQFEQANVIWRELKKTYGDAVALRRAKARWAEVKSHMTGSRVGMPGNLSVGMPNPGSGVTQGPRIVVGGGATGKPINNAHTEGSHAGSTTAGEVLGGSGVDGTIAYRQLRESANPYDPKFDRSASGTAIVGPPTTVGRDAASAPAKDKPDSGDDEQD
jgi:hypothetical protein